MNYFNYKRIWAQTDTGYLVGELDNKLFFTVPGFISEDLDPRRVALTPLPSIMAGQAGGYTIIDDTDLTGEHIKALEYYLNNCELMFADRPPARPDLYAEICKAAGKEVL